MIRKVFSSNNLSSNKTSSLSPTTSTNLTTRTPQSIPTSTTSITLQKQNLKQTPLQPKTQTHTQTQAQPKKKKSLTSFFKRISLEWQYILYRLRAISEDVFESDEFIEDLFIESDTDETLDRMLRSNKGYNSTEEQFLKDFKKYKSLDKMAEANTNTPPVESTNDKVVRTTLQDIIRTQHGGVLDEEDLENYDDEDLEEDDTEYDISYQDLDLNQIRKEFEQMIPIINNRDNTSNNVSDSDTLFSQSNIGTTLWEYRRSKWLSNSSSVNLHERIKSNSIDHIPKDTYVKIYNNLIDRNRQLKDNKRINLYDLIQIINAGWIAEEKWERAGRGLP